MRRIVMTSVLSCLAAMAGCSKSEQQAAAPVAPAPLPVVEPQVVVTEFLEAVRTGNDKLAEAKLTELAREKTRKMDLMVAPPGSPTAKFEVGAAEVTQENQLAYVESRWTDVGENGKPEITEFVWALRMDKGQWRIGGVATQPYPNMPFLQLDFENPEDMLKQSQMAEQEYQRQLKAGTPSAAASGNVAGSAPTAPGTLPSTAGAGQPNALQPGTSPATAAGGSTTTNAGLQTSFDQGGTPADRGVPGAVQPAGGLPASPAQNNSLGGAQPSVGTAPPGVLNSGSEVPFQAQQPAAGNALPR